MRFVPNCPINALERIMIAIALIIYVSTVSYAQDVTLSSIGQRHFKTATTLLEMATTFEQKEMAIAEFEKVKETDPNYPETYQRLGQIYFDIAKETGLDKYFIEAKQNYTKYKTLLPQTAEDIDDELYLIESVRQLSLKAGQTNNKKDFVGVWVDKEWGNVSYIFRIREEGDSFDVKVSTADERVLETLDVIYDGQTLSFTVKDVDRMGAPHEISWGEGNGRVARVTCDVEESFDYWKLSFKNGQLTADAECLNLYYLRGRVERRRRYNMSWTLTRR